MFKSFVLWLLKPKWIVYQVVDSPNDQPHQPELGLMVWGITFSLFKGEVFIPTPAKMVSIRPPEKREFGESLHPV